MAPRTLSGAREFAVFAFKSRVWWRLPRGAAVEDIEGPAWSSLSALGQVTIA